MTSNENPATPLAARAAGRSAELEAVRDAYRRACRGEVRLLLVDGPSATGKGALVDAWLAEHRAGPVLRIEAADSGALESLVEQALAQLSPVRRARHPARALLSLGAEPTEVVDLLVRAEQRLRLHEEVLRLLSELGAGGHTAVVRVDGLHDASRTTLDLLASLVEEAPYATRPDALFVATLDGAPTGRVATLFKQDATRRLSLEPLDRDGVRAFLTSQDVVDAVLSITGGHPELIERLLAGEGVAKSDGVSASTRAALEVLSVTRRALSDEVLCAIADGWSAAELERAGAERVEAGWQLGARQRERVRAATDVARLRTLHAALADAIDEPGTAARHALAAGDVSRATELALDAASRLAARNAAVDAADLLLEVTHAHDAPPIELRRALVELLWIAGDHADAIEHARAYAEESVEGALLLGRLLALAGRSAEAVSTLEAALAEIEDGSRSLAEAALADARYAAGDLEGAEAMARQVCETADLPRALDAGNTLGKIALARGDLDRAETILREELARAEAGGLARAACQALNNLSICAMGRGELARASELLERMLVLASEGGSVYFRGIAHKNLAVVCQLEGQWAVALTHAERALALLGGLANASLLARLSFNTADLHRSLGDPYRALRLCAHARQLALHALDDTVRCEGLRVEAAIHAELGHPGDAKRAWDDALALATGLEHRAAADEARLGLAQLALDEGDPDRAARLLDDVDRDLRSARASARVALIEARLARGEDRIPLARQAIGAAEKTSDPLLVQIAHVELARALRDAGLHGRAREELGLVRERERSLASRVPEASRALFAERAVVRSIAALERDLEGRVSVTPPPTTSSCGMVGESRPMQALRDFIERVGPTESTVLISGESGTGKELVAEALHEASRRADRPFVRVNCAALVDTLLSSELFGHERGAFTGADRAKKGRFELADGGTLLLDEIGDISPKMQASLLRVLQERTFERVGGTRTHHVDVRVIAATHRDLAELVEAGSFREDLYYRLRGIHVQVPALRERLDDLPALCRHLLAKIAEQSDGAPKMLAPDAIAHLSRHGWPGNVRELENVLRSASVLGTGPMLTASDLSAVAAPSARSTIAPPASGASLAALAYERVRDGDGSIYELRKRLERELIERALEDSDGNISQAAQMLGMKRPRLSKLVNEWGLKK